MFTSLFPLDRLFIKISISLLVLTGLLLVFGDHSLPTVKEFSWQQQEVGAENMAFTLNFNRPMDRPKVESDLRITHLTASESSPPQLSMGKDLPGKISWAGQKMLYTLAAPAPYGQRYQINLQGATAANYRGQAIGQPMQPFIGSFRTRGRIFAFIGTTGKSKGRLILGSLDRPVQLLLTPANLVVQDFHFLPKGVGIVFAATSSTPDDSQIYRLSLQPLALDTLKQQLSGSLLSATSIHEIDLASEIPSNLILDNITYQNLKFDLSVDGRYLVVQRIHRQNLQDIGLWAMNLESGTIVKKSSQLGDFLITPDSQSIGVSLPTEHTTMLIDLTTEAQTWQLLAKFQRILSFAPDGSQAAMVKSSRDHTRSLFILNNQGAEKELLKTKGSILSAVFAIDGKTLYCLGTELQRDRSLTLSERPLLLAIDLATAKSHRLLTLDPPLQILLSLSPDGHYLMFDQQPPGASAMSKLLLLPLPKSSVDLNSNIQWQPFVLPVSGLHSRWSP